MRASSLKTVVLPIPGGEYISIPFRKSVERSRFNSGSAAPGTGRGIRRERKEMSLTERIFPSLHTAFPQIPARTPPGREM